MLITAIRSVAGAGIRNEDACELLRHPKSPGTIICAVGDGQGGRPGGAAAAQLACRLLAAKAAAEDPGHLLRKRTWVGLLREVDSAVAGDAEAGFTTLVALCVAQNHICGASSGDSAAVLLNGRERMILTEQQCKNPPVGSGAASFVGFTTRTGVPWTLLAMSDGVWKYAGWDEIVQLTPGIEPEAAIDRLQERATLSGTGHLRDDFTLVVIGDDGDPLKPLAEE